MPDSGQSDRDELVQVGRNDRAELDSLQQRQFRIRCERKYSTVELQPGELPVEEPVRLGGCRDRGTGEGPDGYSPSCTSIRPSLAASTSAW